MDIRVWSVKLSMVDHGMTTKMLSGTTVSSRTFTAENVIQKSVILPCFDHEPWTMDIYVLTLTNVHGQQRFDHENVINWMSEISRKFMDKIQVDMHNIWSTMVWPWTMDIHVLTLTNVNNHENHHQIGQSAMTLQFL